MNQDEEKNFQDQLKIQQQLQQIEIIVKQHLTKDAIARFGNIKSAHPELSLKLLTVLYRAIETGDIKEQITDTQLKLILQQLTTTKQFKIKRV
ncbi:MAG TPA: DNA-binding protein [Candidatus Nanoarchaeia archaeon]|nr:DNA-binding protein [Candidatus Nanoarchaeia archaeon]